MAIREHKVKNLESFNVQLLGTLNYITYELANPIASQNLYDKVMEKIEVMRFFPKSPKIYKEINGIKFYKISVKNYRIVYRVKKDTMELRRFYYYRQNYDSYLNY